MNNNAQRVNIQFSLDLDDLPGEVSRLFERASAHSDEASNTFGTFSHQDEPLSVVSLNKINDIRLALTKADLVLDDLQKIIGGYLRMQAEPPVSAQEEEAESKPEPRPRPPDINMLPPDINMMPPKSPFAQSVPDTGPDRHLSLEELQTKVKKVVEAMQNEESVESAVEGV